jgi:hypothetical protein
MRSVPSEVGVFFGRANQGVTGMVLGRCDSQPEAQGKMHRTVRDKGTGPKECGAKYGGSTSCKRRAGNEPPVLSFFIQVDRTALLYPAIEDAGETLRLLGEGESRMQHSTGGEKQLKDRRHGRRGWRSSEQRGS